MARADSYNKVSAKNVLKEHFRELKKYKNFVDVTKSGSNYHFGTANTAKECMEQVQKRASEIMQGKDMQTQTNIMSSWVVSLPKELSTEQAEDFFGFVYMFCQDRYGRDNVIDGHVHFDETTPHIHVCLIPEAISRKTGRKTVSSASLFTRSELHNFQADLNRQCEKRYGIKNLILNGKTKGGVSLEQLKENTAKERAEQWEEQVQKLIAEHSRLQAENERLIQENTVLFSENKDLADENNIRRQKNINYQLERFKSSVKDSKKADFASVLSVQEKLESIANLPRKEHVSKQAIRMELAEQVTENIIKRGKRAGKISPAEQLGV